MESAKKINRILIQVRKLTTEEIEATVKMAKDQCSYVHPLKYATSRKINKTGKRNLKVIKALTKLKSEIEKPWE